MNRIGNTLLALLTLWACTTQAAVTAGVDRNRVAESDSLELIIKATAREPVSQTDLSPLKADFDVVNTGTYSRRTIANGKDESSTELKVVLLPRRSGRLRIPPLQVGKQLTREILVEVTAAPQGLDSSRDVFVEAEVDRTSVFVQSQLIHTFRLYDAVGLVDLKGAGLDIPDAVMEQLDTREFNRTINGRAYRVIEVRHAIFPQKSGKLTIPAMSISGSRVLPRRSFFDRNVETLRRRSYAIEVDVKPIPASYPDAPWIPASSLKLEESWSALPEELEIGDSVTRTLTMIADGIDGSQLPPLELEPITGIKAYPDQPKSENTRGADGITGIGVNSAALLLTEPGEFILPAIRIPWWDTNQNKVRYAEIPAQRLNIEPAVLPVAAAGESRTPQPTQAPAAVQVNQDTRWMWATLAALLGWLTTTAWLLWRMQPRTPRTRPSDPDRGEAELFRALQKACQRNHARDTRTTLHQWGQARFASRGPLTVEQLRQRIADAKFAAALDELERSLYSASPGDWSGAEFDTALTAWRKQHPRANDGKDSPLPPLYPPALAAGTSSGP